MYNGTYAVKRGDTWPKLAIVCTDDGAPVDLTTAASIRIIGRQFGVTIFSKSVTGDVNGLVLASLVAGDTDRSGPMSVEVEVTWSPTEIQTFPPDTYLTLDIVEDLG